MKKKCFIFFILSFLCCNVAVARSKNNSEVMVVKTNHGAKWGDFFDNMFYPDGYSKYEVGYTYASIAPVNTLFPVGFYGEWAYEWIAVSAEFAANVSETAYEMSKKAGATYDPIVYFMAGLGANINILSINFNAGVVRYDYKYSSTIDGMLNTTKNNKYAAILQPSIHIHIPVDDWEHFISLKLGYNICPAMHEFNGLNIGIGFGGWCE